MNPDIQVERQCWLVIPATGVGQRMLADRPKQYLELKGKTILQHTLDNVLAHPAVSGAVLVLNSEDGYWASLDYHPQKPLLRCTGGAQRHHSVFNGLTRLKEQIGGNPLVLIHDAVRPFVSHEDLDRLLEAAQQDDDGALLAVPVADTLKLADKQQRIEINHPRDHLWRAFTPQAFYLDNILRALQAVIDNNLAITDDASAMELMGYHPRLIGGSELNIKITRPQDLLLAELILGMNQ